MASTAWTHFIPTNRNTCLSNYIQFTHWHLYLQHDILLFARWVRDSHAGDYEEYNLLGLDTVQSSRCSLRHRRNLLPPSSRPKSKLTCCMFLPVDCCCTEFAGSFETLVFIYQTTGFTCQKTDWFFMVPSIATKYLYTKPLNILTLFISLSYSQHVSAPTSHLQVRYTISYYFCFWKTILIQRIRCIKLKKKINSLHQVSNLRPFCS
jgi:hypothetical protein